MAAWGRGVRLRLGLARCSGVAAGLSRAQPHAGEDDFPRGRLGPGLTNQPLIRMRVRATRPGLTKQPSFPLDRSKGRRRCRLPGRQALRAGHGSRVTALRQRPRRGEPAATERGLAHMRPSPSQAPGPTPAASRRGPHGRRCGAGPVSGMQPAMLAPIRRPCRLCGSPARGRRKHSTAQRGRGRVARTRGSSFCQLPA